MVVQHNMQAMNSNRMLNITTSAQAKSTERLSSGYKINRAADDAAGLSISEKMRKQIRGLTQASANAQDGISAVQTAEGKSDVSFKVGSKTSSITVEAGDDAAKIGGKIKDALNNNKYSDKVGGDYTATNADAKITLTAAKNGVIAADDKLSATANKDVTLKASGILTLDLHVGADSTADNQISVDIKQMSADVLGLKTGKSSTTAAENDTLLVNGSNDDNARKAIDTIASALQEVSKQRSALGAAQNRLEHTISNLDNVVENTTSAESSIRDTDMATEMVKYSNNNILAQAGQAMLAQANQSNQGVLSLLQ